MPAGYSKRSLIEKLGIKPNFKLILINSPENYNELLGKIGFPFNENKKLNGEFDFIQFFTKSEKELKEKFLSLKKHLKNNGMIWISWPKKSSKVAADLDENIIRDLGLQIGLVDVKVCAVSEIWSGLKFVIRKENRTNNRSS